jgi:hypothetical protein
MQLLREQDVHQSPESSEIVYRESRLAKWVALGICLGLALAGTVALSWPGALVDTDTRFVTKVLASVALLFGLLVQSPLRKTYHQENWLLRQRQGGLLVKFRSYLNSHFPKEDLTVLDLDRDEIEWIRRHAHKHVSKRIDCQQSAESLAFLDIKVRFPVEGSGEDWRARLKRQLKAARNQKAPKVGIVQTKYHHYPVRLVEEDILRIEWKSKTSSVTPGIGAAITNLGRDYRVGEEIGTESDEGPGSTGEKETVGKKGSTGGPESPYENEELLLDMLSRGDEIGAAKLARSLYGFDTTEAMRFLEELKA